MLRGSKCYPLDVIDMNDGDARQHDLYSVSSAVWEGYLEPTCIALLVNVSESHNTSSTMQKTLAICLVSSLTEF